MHSSQESTFPHRFNPVMCCAERQGNAVADTALQNAKRQRDELAAKINAAQAQIEEWKREAARADRFIQDWHAFAGHVVAPAGDIPPHSSVADTPSSNSTSKRTKGNSDKDAVARAAREVIEQAGKPVARAELLARIRERGLTIEGSPPETVLSTMLWRMKDDVKLVHIKGLGYWLADHPSETAGSASQGDVFE
jgi:Tfp pilus assembly protein FimV